MRLFSNSSLRWGATEGGGVIYFSVIYFNKFLSTLLSYCSLYSFRNIKRLNENSKVRSGGSGSERGAVRLSEKLPEKQQFIAADEPKK